MLPALTLLLAGSIVAMLALVTAVAGVATLTTQQLHRLFTAANPKDKDLDALLRAWRAELGSGRAELMRLKRAELDLLAQTPVPDKAPAKGRLPESGLFTTIYQEPLARFRIQEFPRAKVLQRLIVVTTPDHEYVYRTRGAETLITLNGQAFGAFRQNRLYPPGKVEVWATLEPQRDGRTVHLDREEHTVAILYVPGASRGIAPRAFEFVDVDTDGERRLLEALGFHFLLTANSPVA